MMSAAISIGSKIPGDACQWRIIVKLLPETSILYPEVTNSNASRPRMINPSTTSNAATVLGWTGGMNQYKYGTLGVIEEGAYADMILVDGNPLEDLSLIRDYERNFKLILKDGRIWKNTL